MGSNDSRAVGSRKPHRSREQMHRLGLIPSPDYPLNPHQWTKRWYKVVKGQRHYFGRLDQPDAALAEWLRVKDFLEAGKTPPDKVDDTSTADYVTLENLLDFWLAAKERKVDAKERSVRTFRDHMTVAEMIRKRWGRFRRPESIGSAEFADLRADLAAKLSPDAANKKIYLVRAVFLFGHQEKKIGLPAPDFGTEFVKIDAKRVEQARQESHKDDKQLEPADLRALIDAASVPMRAAILLGLNAAFGNRDIGTLPKSAIDLDAGFVEYARTKTAAKRRAALWPETIAAIKAAIEERPQPAKKEDDRLVFLTKFGRPYVREGRHEATRGPNAGKERPVPVDTLGPEFAKLLHAQGMAGPGRGFYALRHCFRTAADDAIDRAAVDLVMGHAKKSDVARFYTRHAEMDQRLKAVANHVHRWLYGKSKGKR